MKKVFAAAAAAVLSMNMVFSAFAATKLEAPTNVQWKEGAEATMQWDRVENAAGKYNVEIYHNGQAKYGGRHSWPATNQNDVLTAVSFRNELEYSGDYKFRVMALGDEKSGFENSDWSEFSDTWSYTRPDISFGEPSNARWDGTVSLWDAPTDAVSEEYAEYLAGYEIELYADGEPLVGHNCISGLEFDEVDWMTEEGAVYTFAIRAISNTPSVIYHGPWVTAEGSYDGPTQSEAIADQIDKIMEDEAAINNAPDTLSENLEKVQAGMQTDEELVNKITQLEEAYMSLNNINAYPHVFDDVDMDESQIKVVGAGLNAEKPNSDVILNVSKPEKEVVVDHTAYRNAVQVDLSLDGASKKLKVPVQITLPIPDSINPEFLQILHYHSDGHYEVIMPPQLIINDDNTATFTVTSFSTFVLAEEGADLALIATPSNATEFKNLVDSLPEAGESWDSELVADNMAKIREAIQKRVILAKDMDEEMVEKLDAIIIELASIDDEFSFDLTYEGELIDDVIGAYLLAYVEGDAQEIIFYHENLATNSNATSKMSFTMKASLIKKDGKTYPITGLLPTPVAIRIITPDYYDEIYKSTDKISGAVLNPGPINYEDGSFYFFTNRLGKVSITGQSSSSSGSSSSSSGRARSGIVKESDLPKSPAGGSWKLTDGKYFYYYSDGTPAKNVWLEINSVWYYFGTDGIMATGWLKDNGNYFYLDPATGAMVTGWKEIDGTWYYFNTIGNGFKGMMLADTTVDGYALDSNGAWIQ